MWSLASFFVAFRATHLVTADMDWARPGHNRNGLCLMTIHRKDSRVNSQVSIFWLCIFIDKIGLMVVITSCVSISEVYNVFWRVYVAPDHVPSGPQEGSITNRCSAQKPLLTLSFRIHMERGGPF